MWQNEDPGRGGDFFRLFAKALYGGRLVPDLPIPDVTCQLAAMAARAGVYTTNYDPLLELGMARLYEAGTPYKHWQKFRGGPESVSGPRVRHVHGWVDPDGHWGGSFVLAESHYIALQTTTGAAPNRDLSEILDGEGAVLIVGMSLSDPNLRRLLYQRGLSPFAIAPTYAIIKKTDHEKTDEYRQSYWRLRKTTIISIDTHESLLPVLRDIQFGASTPDERPNWLPAASAAVRDQNPFSNDWQRTAWGKLRDLRDLIAKKGADPASEVVQLSLFRVISDASEIQRIGSTRPPTASTGVEATDQATRRRLSVRVGQEQGVAGNSFAKGLKQESFTPQGLNLRFTDQMVQDWETDFESLVAVPIHAAVLHSGERAWLPVGVVVATSSIKTADRTRDGRSAPSGPCWHESAEVLPLLRGLGERLLLGNP